jgi:hypothetical protein
VALDAVEQGAHLEPYRLTIYDLRREGPYVVLDFGIACRVPGGGCDSRLNFSLPLGTGTSPEAEAGVNEPSAVTLVDPVTDRQYAVVYDSHAKPQASELPFQSIDDNALHLAWVKRTDVLFKFAKSNLTARAKAILGPLAAKIKSRAAGSVQVTGRSPSTASTAKATSRC